tara:strand:- start:174 stop:404 length:231 start_codon:yes stop_codon:yes gene_type:complete
VKDIKNSYTANALFYNLIRKVKIQKTKTSPFLRRLEVHYPVNLSNSFIEDLEKVGKFYEKHKEYIRSNSEKNLEEA